MKVFAHHVYEYRKGLRNLILHTTRAEHRPAIESRLTKYAIDYIIYPLSNGNINLFFGTDECVETVRRIGKASLCDYTPEEDFMLGVMLGYDRLAQCRRYLIRQQKRRPLLPPCRQPGVWQECAAPTRPGFTLIELLIVLGILGALASLMLSGYAVDRKKTLDDSIVQKELADIQKAFQYFSADCVPKNDDYKLISKYGLAVLMKLADADGGYPVSGDSWSFASGSDAPLEKCWRGPYVEREGSREIDPTCVGQENGSVKIPVVQTPYSKEETDDQYYRVVATRKKIDNDGTETNKVIAPHDSLTNDWDDRFSETEDSYTYTWDDLQFWVVAPENGVFSIAVGDDIEDENVIESKFRRRLLLDRE